MKVENTVIQEDVKLFNELVKKSKYPIYFTFKRFLTGRYKWRLHTSASGSPLLLGENEIIATKLNIVLTKALEEV